MNIRDRNPPKMTVAQMLHLRRLVIDGLIKNAERRDLPHEAKEKQKNELMDLLALLVDLEVLLD